MIKTVACGLMLLDHIGLFFFPTLKVLRIVGRFAMPFFAYGIARGYFYTKQKGSQHVRKYIFQMLLFAVISQIPYLFLFQENGSVNIGFTWFLSLLFLMTINKKNGKMVYKVLITIFLFFCAEISGTEYGVYGVLMPYLMYLYLVIEKAQYKAFMSLTVLWGFYVAQENGSAMALLQVVSIFSIPMVCFLKKYDTKLRLPKPFYYWFYPVHLFVITLVKIYTKY